MNRPDPISDQPLERNDPFGLSTFSIRRYSVQHMVLLFTVIGLLIGTNVVAVLHGNTVLIVLAGTLLGLTLAMTALVLHVGIRTVAVEIWIRRLGMGDFEYRIEPRGNDEVSKACLALETLRQSSIRAMQLDLVQKLSDELQEKNATLEDTLDELRKSQDRIISQQKLAELGELSAGVAHEIRNPLQFIRNFATASEDIAGQIKAAPEQPDDGDLETVDELTEDLVENMRRIVMHSERADRIIADLLVMGRRGDGAFEPVDLNPLLAKQASLAYQAAQAQTPGFSATVRQQLDPDVGRIVAVPEDLARVFTNLVTNACHAVAERAELSGDDYAPELRIGSRRTAEGVEVTIRDNGMGMTPEVMAKIFSPFFTTKESSRSTGLGLTLSHEIVREHGGQIVAESQPGEFTEMTVQLPRNPGDPGHMSERLARRPTTDLGVDAASLIAEERAARDAEMG
ncbi:MAG: ATP-binding protein [Chloroflexi bacterium]|nr:ATP-binding protein [Chloroflexota bacterium]